MKFNSIKRTMNGLLVALAIFMASPTAMAFVADTTSLNGSLTGLWNNTDQSGWGAAIIHQYGIIFATFYTYDNAGNPTWYVASACAVSGSGCTGPLYTVTGGTNPIDVWNAPNKVVTQVGTMTFNFTDANTGTMSYSINSWNGMKSITRSVFASPPTGTTTPPVSGGQTGPFGAINLQGGGLPGQFIPISGSGPGTGASIGFLQTFWQDSGFNSLSVSIADNYLGLYGNAIQLSVSGLTYVCKSGFAGSSGNCNGASYNRVKQLVTFSNVQLVGPGGSGPVVLNGSLSY